jgi:hypothetical protein
MMTNANRVPTTVTFSGLYSSAEIRKDLSDVSENDVTTERMDWHISTRIRVAVLSRLNAPKALNRAREANAMVGS